MATTTVMANHGTYRGKGFLNIAYLQGDNEAYAMFWIKESTSCDFFKQKEARVFEKAEYLDFHRQEVVADTLELVDPHIYNNLE